MSRLTPKSRLLRVLIAYYGLLQFVHLLVLIQALRSLIANGEIGFPAMPPSNGWSIQTSNFLIGMGLIDAINVLLALIFIYGYFKLERWWLSMGLISLTVAMSSAWIFGYGTAFSNAWFLHPWAYGVMVFLFTPSVILFVYLWSLGARSTISL